jgi:tripartite-type tricarboxylate transporter receptor subunit TctC
MRTSLGQSIIIENVAGANGSIGVGRVARAAPDGHTIVIGYWARTSRMALFTCFPTTCCAILSPSH